MSHPMMPEPSHDERAEQLFVRDFKIWLSETAGPSLRKLAETVGGEMGYRHGDAVAPVRDALLANDLFRTWTSYRRLSQEMMWDAVVSSVDRQIDHLHARARIDSPRGSVRLDPDLVVPSYIAALDIHLMPGGYHHDRGQGDVRQGAVIDRGGAIYMLGRNGGLMNDVRGHTTVQHLYERYPDHQPARILELGCGVGASTVAVASYFPEAEVYGVDIGAAMLRYAHSRAEHLGQRVHFVQADAEHTGFDDASFDLVYSCVLLHETSSDALRGIMAECQRLLRPGGVVIHTEVPGRDEDLGLWGKLQGEFEALFNNEPYWRGVQSVDLGALMGEAGFRDAAVGYQLATPRARRGARGYSEESSGPFRSWYIISARKQA